MSVQASTPDSTPPKEQTPQNSLTAAIAVLGGALCAGHPVLQGVMVSAAPFLSSGIFSLLRYWAARVREHREIQEGRKGFDDYLQTIEKRLKALPADSPERIELATDAAEVRRARHAEMMKLLTARSQSALPLPPIRVPLTSKPAPPASDDLPSTK